MGSIRADQLVEEEEKRQINKQVLTINCVQLVTEKMEVESPFRQNGQRRPLQGNDI